MSSALATTALLLVAWLSFAVALAAAVSAAWPRWARRREADHPALRERVALVAAATPGLGAALLVLACLAPGLLGLLGAGDHCTLHADHPHLCVVHTTATLGRALDGVLAVAAIGLVLALARGVARVAQTRRQLVALRSAGARGRDPDVTVLDSRRPFSFATGLVRKEIWVSSALVDALPADALEVVVAHERAHLERRDLLRRAVAGALSLPLWPSVRRALLAELVLVSELACDERAARRVGSRLRVAETILAVERLAGANVASAPAEAPAFGGSAVAQRVQSLLDERRSVRAPRAASWAALALLAVGVLALSADPLHHLTEHWLRFLLHG